MKLRATDRWITILLHRSRPGRDRGHRIPKMGPQGGRSNAIFIDGLLLSGRPTGSARGQGFHIFCTASTRAHPDCGRSDWNRPGRPRRAARNMHGTRACSIARLGQNRGQHPLAELDCIWRAAWQMARAPPGSTIHDKLAAPKPQQRQIPGARAVTTLPGQAIATHGWLWICQGVSRERLFREVPYTARADYRTADPQLHRREGLDLADELLNKHLEVRVSQQLAHDSGCRRKIAARVGRITRRQNFVFGMKP